MSKWVNFRDELLSTLKFDEVDDKVNNPPPIGMGGL